MNKKTYLTPTTETIFMQMEDSILTGSDGSDVKFSTNEEEADAWSSGYEYSEDDFSEE